MAEVDRFWGAADVVDAQGDVGAKSLQA